MLWDPFLQPQQSELSIIDQFPFENSEQSRRADLGITLTLQC